LSEWWWWLNVVTIVSVATLLGGCALGLSQDSVSSSEQNACLFRAEPTAMPSDATAIPSPTPPPRPAATPWGYLAPSPTPSPTPGPTVESIPLRLPDGVDAWADAIVEVGELTDSGGARKQAGLVVSEDEAVLAVFQLPPRPDGLQVTVGGQPVPAMVEAFEPLTGTTLLRVEATGLTVAPLDAWNVSSTGGRVLAIWPDRVTGDLVVEGMLATPDELSPKDLFALMVNSEARRWVR
jgi:hypothetical protein